MGDWLLLLPPSETKATPPKNGMKYDTARGKKITNSFKILEPLRQELILALTECMDRGIGLDRIFELRGAALDDALRINRAIVESTTLPARELYAGVLYQALNYKKLTKDEQKRFDSNTLIVSGLFGVLRPMDRIPPYKLKIGANIGGMVGKVANYWRQPASEIIRHEARQKVVWDFLPDQHRRVWDSSGEIRACHSVKFVKRVVHRGVAEWKTISHHSKALKGALVRHLLKKDAMNPKALHDFEHPDGYFYEPSLSVHSTRAAQLVFASE